MIPIFDMKILGHEITIFYQNIGRRESNFSKTLDNGFVTVFVIIKICRLSVQFSKLTPYIYPVLQDDTSKFLALVQHVRRRSSKMAISQLQCVVLRFLHWCAPEDGNGAQTQYCQILMGTIISSCKEMGINWYCFIHTGKSSK